MQDLALRARGLFAGRGDFDILNVSAARVSARTGGVAIQLIARLRAERALRSVALVHPGEIRLSAPFMHARRIGESGFDGMVREALAVTGAKAIHLEGTSGAPVAGVLRLLDAGVSVVVSVHDFSLFCARPHLLEQPMDRFCDYSRDFDRCHRCFGQDGDVPKNQQAEWRELARRLLASARGVIFPSRFLLEKHRELFSLPQLRGEVIEPGAAAAQVIASVHRERRGVAYAGSVQRHKGAHLLPDVARALARRGVDLHVFGGGDRDLLRALREVPNVVVHGYYRNGTLPSLLARHRVGLVMLPSIVPEAYCLTMSEAWQAGASVAAFDAGAMAERIRRDGGGWLAPLAAGAEGLVDVVERWLSGELDVCAPIVSASPADAARAHCELYKRWGLRQ